MSWWRTWTSRGQTPALEQASAELEAIRLARDRFRQMPDERLADPLRTGSATEVIAAVSVAASRTLGLEMYDEQLAAALALAEGHIVEMQTGEGKTLAAVPAVVWLARYGQGVHVLTANDYLARRDAAWMRGVYERLGLTVACVQQDMDTAARRTAYLADVTYATANEVGFDYLRDGLAIHPTDQVHRTFSTAVVDEADSILIDEARVPLVIAAGGSDHADLATRADGIVRDVLERRQFTVEGHGRNIQLTPAGVARVERAMGCENLFDDEALPVHTAIQDALHAHVLLQRDVDYVVAGDTVLPVDELKGRLVPDRRWPAGLQTALEVKEGTRLRRQGRVQGSITIENLAGHYRHLCGMTGTAATQTEEFREIYGLEVRIIPTHRPVIRQDLPDEVFATRAEKEAAVGRAVRDLHRTGRPVLVGTASVAESERLSRSLADIPHHVLNARHEAAEAAIVARAGQPGAVTISTNMAGRGVDIRLGEGVSSLGGLYVIGTNRHESRRIDLQLRGRAGRQGDPGSSRFFLSREDPLFRLYADDDDELSPDQCQRFVEGEHLDMRLFLRKYESVIEAQRLAIRERRQTLVDAAGLPDSAGERERLVRLAVIDELWSDYLAAVAELRSGSAWISLGYGDPLGHYLRQVHAMFGRLEASIEPEVAGRLALAPRADPEPVGRGATWTYLTTDEPFGRMTNRVMRELVRRRRARTARRRARAG